MTRIVNPGRVILSTPQNGLLGPAQILRHRWFNRAHCPLVKLLITLTQASGEDMILPTIQLLRIALITRLMLLLIPLMVMTSLIALVPLIAMFGLIALKS